MHRSFVEYWALSLLFVFSQFSIGTIKIWDDPKNGTLVKINQWEVHDLTYQLKNAIESPFSKQAYALVKGGDGTQKVPLFYNGDNSWVFRFSSATIGSKSFTIDSEIAELHGRSGTFNISPNTKPDRHGGIVLKKDNPQHFFYEDGTHYTNLAFECDWLFALDYGKAETPKTNHLLEQIAKNGFNQIVMNVYSYDVRWPKDERLKQHPEHEYGSREDIFPFLGSNSKPDHSSLNLAFFQHFDRVIAEMHDRELVSHLMVYVWNKLVAWPPMNSEADNLYYDHVIKRYQAFPNIVWDISKEALHHERATKEYISERIERTRKLDSYNRLVSVHDYGFCRNNADQVDFISMQNWKHTLYQHMLEARSEFPEKPIFNIEHGGYEESPYVVFPGAYASAEACLRRNYLCLFAGGYTTYYWQGASWNVVIHNPFEQPDDFIKPRFDYFSHLRTLMDAVNFENCVPQPNSNSSGYNLTNKKDGIILLYCPKENHSISGKKQIKRDYDFSRATFQWFNTLTGEFTKEEKYVDKVLTFWDHRPWRDEADAVIIYRNLRALPQ